MPMLPWIAVLLASLHAIAVHLHQLLKWTIEGTWAEFVRPHLDLGLFYVATHLLPALKGEIYRLSSEQIVAYGHSLGVPFINDFYVYLPSAYLILWPLGQLPYPVVRVLWVLLAESSLVLAIFIPRLLVKDRLPRWWYWFAPFLVLQFFPIQPTLFFGQPTLIMLGVSVLGLMALQRERRVLGGALVGLCCVFKPPLHLVWPYFLYRKQWVTALAGIGTAALMELVSWLVVGGQTYQAWREQIARRVQMSTGRGLENFGLPDMLARVLSTSMYHPVLLGALGICFLLAMWVTWRALRHSRWPLREELPYGLGLMFVWSWIFCPVTHEPYLCLLLLPFLLVWARLGAAPSPSMTVLFIVSFLLVGLRYSLIRFPLFETGPLALLTAARTIGMWLLGVCVLRLLRQGRGTGTTP